MSDYQSLLARKAQLEHESKLLEEQLDAARKAAKQETIAKIRALMQEGGIEIADLGVARRIQSATGHKSAGKPVAIKYRNTVTGETWTGRGLQPKWITAAIAAGKTIDEFKV